jgi:hypothetical protein
MNKPELKNGIEWRILFEKNYEIMKKSNRYIYIWRRVTSFSWRLLKIYIHVIYATNGDNGTWHRETSGELSGKHTL